MGPASDTSPRVDRIVVSVLCRVVDCQGRRSMERLCVLFLVTVVGKGFIKFEMTEFQLSYCVSLPISSHFE